MTERANTMKTYILGDAKAVEPQNLSRPESTATPTHARLSLWLGTGAGRN
jgi:hypothetical protein